MTNIFDKVFLKDLLITLSEWLINLSAGWFGSVFFLPFFTNSNPILLLIINIPAAILGLVASIILKRKANRL